MNPPSFTALLITIRKAESVATITAESDPKNHNYLTYQYSVGGRTYTGVGYGPDGHEMALGDQMRVCFFPAHPQSATIATDKEQKEYVREGAMAGIAMATFLTIAVYWKFFRTRENQVEQTTA
jgi:hypothetical protein